MTPTLLFVAPQADFFLSHRARLAAAAQADGWRAVVAGLDDLTVAAGSRVEEGQALGRSGPDGEVYFELRRDERPIDPAPWLS